MWIGIFHGGVWAEAKFEEAKKVEPAIVAKRNNAIIIVLALLDRGFNLWVS